MVRANRLKLALLAATCLASGCVIVQVGVTNPVPSLSKVAVVPFFNLSQEKAVDGRRFALAYFAELQKVPGFQVVPVGVTEQAIYDNNLQMQGPEDALELARILGVDIVVVGAVTDYDPYYPPRVGLQVSWYSPYAVELPLPMAFPADAVVGESGGAGAGPFRCSRSFLDRARAIKASLQRFRPLTPRRPFRLNDLDFFQRAQSPEEVLEAWEPIGADRVGPAELEQSAVEQPEKEQSELEQREVDSSETDAPEFERSAPVAAERSDGPSMDTGASEGLRLSEDGSGVASLRSDVFDGQTLGSPDGHRLEAGKRMGATPRTPPASDPLVPDDTASSFPTADLELTAQERADAAEPGSLTSAVPGQPSQAGLASGEGKGQPRWSAAASKAPAWDYSPEYRSDAFWRESRFWELQLNQADRIAQTAYEAAEPNADSGEPWIPWPTEAMGTASVAAPQPQRDPRKPLMSYSRLFDGADADLVARLRDYVELSGDRRSGGWEAYLHRSEDFIRFTTHVMIVEMLTMHGGETRRRFIFKLRKRM